MSSVFKFSVITEEYIYGILRKAAAVNNLREWGYTQEKFENIAQNYFGLLIPVVLTGKVNGKETKIRLVLKLAPTDERYRVSGAVTVMFVREIFVYTVILKKYQKLQENLPDPLKYIMPHCHCAQNEYCKEYLVLQDMQDSGYKPYTHNMFLDLEHMVVSLKALAKFHALSVVLRLKEPDLYDIISKNCVPLTDTSNARYMDVMRDRLDKAMKKFEKTKYEALLDKLHSECGTHFGAAYNSVQYTCICHGDIWKENILYQYKNEKPVSACLIDYQTTRICSPAFDVLYLILSSTKSTLRQKYFSSILDIYYENFDKILHAFGLEAIKIYSRPMFDQDLSKVAPACLITANTALWLSCGLQEVGHVKSKQVFNTKEEKEAAVALYKETVKAIIDDLATYGYINVASPQSKSKTK